MNEEQTGLTNKYPSFKGDVFQGEAISPLLFARTLKRSQDLSGFVQSLHKKFFDISYNLYIFH